MISAANLKGAQAPGALSTFILKISSRCNLNCSYCFVYNKGDEQWRRQPRFMNDDTLEATCGRIAEHAVSHGVKDVKVILHGGEPMLLGAAKLDVFARNIRSRLGIAGVECNIGMQTNVTLLTRAIADICRKNRIRIGVSLDGPPSVNDRVRVDRKGRGSSSRAERGLVLLAGEFRDLFSGFLTVVDVGTDPTETIDYLMKFNPKSIDFLLPYDNWDRYPARKLSATSTEYGEWLIRAFDYWVNLPSRVRVRSFESYIRCMVGGKSLVESVGLDPVRLIVVESNGDIEAVDSLKASFDGATRLGFDVFRNTFDDAVNHVDVRARQMGSAALCEACQDCQHLTTCGGGYLPNRYSLARGFRNPSVFCSDLKLLLPHIEKTLRFQLVEAERSVVTG